MFGKTYYAWVIGAVLASEMAIITAIRFLRLEPDVKVGIVTFTAIPLLLITVMELGRNLRLQRAAFIKDYISQFFTNVDLYQTFHELIYDYTDVRFEKVESIRKEQHLDNQEKPVFAPFESLQGGRQTGSRLYHPRLFQGSPEERRLDALLGYFDVIAYYYAKGYLRIEDIVGSVGYFLAVMKARKVVSDYLKANREAWMNPEYNSSMGVTPPFAYLQRLLDDIQEYNARFERRIKVLQSRRLR
jgi:predicted outer membrane lipoprotein